jgi:hypothetical protein
MRPLPWPRARVAANRRRATMPPRGIVAGVHTDADHESASALKLYSGLMCLTSEEALRPRQFGVIDKVRRSTTSCSLGVRWWITLAHKFYSSASLPVALPYAHRPSHVHHKSPPCRHMPPLCCTSRSQTKTNFAVRTRFANHNPPKHED